MQNLAQKNSHKITKIKQSYDPLKINLQFKVLSWVLYQFAAFEIFSLWTIILSNAILKIVLLNFVQIV